MLHRQTSNKSGWQLTQTINPPFRSAANFRSAQKLCVVTTPPGCVDARKRFQWEKKIAVEVEATTLIWFWFCASHTQKYAYFYCSPKSCTEIWWRKLSARCVCVGGEGKCSSFAPNYVHAHSNAAQRLSLVQSSPDRRLTCNFLRCFLVGVN